MSRQHKQRNKRTSRLNAIFDHDEKDVRVGKRKPGPSKTHPKHGKVHTWYRKGASK